MSLAVEGCGKSKTAYWPIFYVTRSLGVGFDSNKCLIVCQAAFSILNCKHRRRTAESEKENMESKYTINANYYLIYIKNFVSVLKVM